MVAAAVVTVVIVVAACGQAPAPDGSARSPDASEPTGQPIILEGRDAGFALSLRVGTDVVDAGTPIDVAATLIWEGANPMATIWGSGSGPVSFELEQIDGDMALGGMMTADCAMHDYARLVPVQIPYRKSGGFSGDDPNAGFYRAFFADPVLRLPAGRWRVTANAGGYLMPCEMDAPTVDISLSAEILVR
jgi:hypothetical protein